MDFAPDLVVYSALKQNIPEELYETMRIGITNTYGVALQFMIWSDFDNEYITERPDHETYTVLMWLGIWTGVILGVSVVATLGYCIYYTYKQFALDAIFDDPAMRKDAVLLLELCKHLFDYESNIDHTSASIHRKYFHTEKEASHITAAKRNALLAQRDAASRWPLPMREAAQREEYKRIDKQLEVLDATKTEADDRFVSRGGMFDELNSKFADKPEEDDPDRREKKMARDSFWQRIDQANLSRRPSPESNPGLSHLTYSLQSFRPLSPGDSRPNPDPD